MPTRSREVRERRNGLNDPRIRILARTIEARWPGTRVVVEPYRSPEHPRVRWWVYILHCRRQDLRKIHYFAIRTGLDLLERKLDFIADPRESRGTRAYLEGRRRERGAARGFVLSNRSRAGRVRRAATGGRALRRTA